MTRRPIAPPKTLTHQLIKALQEVPSQSVKSFLQVLDVAADDGTFSSQDFKQLGYPQWRNMKLYLSVFMESGLVEPYPVRVAHHSMGRPRNVWKLTHKAKRIHKKLNTLQNTPDMT